MAVARAIADRHALTAGDALNVRIQHSEAAHGVVGRLEEMITAAIEATFAIDGDPRSIARPRDQQRHAVRENAARLLIDCLHGGVEKGLRLFVFDPVHADDFARPRIGDNAAEFVAFAREQEFKRAALTVEGVEIVELSRLVFVEHGDALIGQHARERDGLAESRYIFTDQTRRFAIIEEEPPAIGGVVRVGARDHGAAPIKQIAMRVRTGAARRLHAARASGQIDTVDCRVIARRRSRGADDATEAWIALNGRDKPRALIRPLHVVVGGEQANVATRQMEDAIAVIIDTARRATEAHVLRQHVVRVEGPADKKRNALVVAPANAAQTHALFNACRCDLLVRIDADHLNAGRSLAVTREHDVAAVGRDRDITNCRQAAIRLNGRRRLRQGALSKRQR
ncbi:MAG: hypothetical protein K2P70_14555 [Hyphomonadaceae bacterium]|nr:hypothetical protein [Hyphomonadaceae bacterium]